jgi:hypothetical protein
MDLRQLQDVCVCFPNAPKRRPETVRPQNVTELRMTAGFDPHEAVSHRLPPPGRLENGGMGHLSKASVLAGRTFTNCAASALRVINA